MNLCCCIAVWRIEDFFLRSLVFLVDEPFAYRLYAQKTPLFQSVRRSRRKNSFFVHVPRGQGELSKGCVVPKGSLVFLSQCEILKAACAA